MDRSVIKLLGLKLENIDLEDDNNTAGMNRQKEK